MSSSGWKNNLARPSQDDTNSPTPTHLQKDCQGLDKLCYNYAHEISPCKPYWRKMTITLEIDEILLKQAQTLTSNDSPTDIVNSALQLYVQRHQQAQILELFGTIDYDEGYDYKHQRSIP